MNLRKLTPAAILPLTVALAACGSSSSSGGLSGGQADNVRQAAQQVITNPAKVCSLLTGPAIKAYTQQLSGKAARAACTTDVQQSHLPKSAKVVVLSVNGDNAQAAYTTSAGNVGAMTLKKVNGAWLMDQVRLIVPR